MTVISLCIPTMDRPLQLLSCLRSIEEGSELPFETIVSDDSSDEGLNGHVTERFSWIRYQRGPGRGLGANRNACIESLAGTTTHVAFIDDDAIVPPAFVATLRRLAERSDAHTIVTGSELTYVNGQQRKSEVRNADFLGFQRSAWGAVGASLCINASIFPRQLFDRRRFDENLRYGYEEIDIARQAVANGYQIRYSDDLWVNHYPVATKPYMRYAHASRLYATLNAYWRYERAYGKAAAFALIGPLHHLAAAALKRHDESLIESARSIGTALRYLVRSGRSVVADHVRSHEESGRI